LQLLVQQPVANIGYNAAGNLAVNNNSPTFNKINSSIGLFRNGGSRARLIRTLRKRSFQPKPSA